jgi:hypothetical protein
MSKIKFLPSLATLTAKAEIGDWREKVEEIKRLCLEEIGLFMTALKEKERYQLYAALKETSVKKILFVHLRTDMKPEEIVYLIENFHSEVFNLHMTSRWPLLYDYSKYAKQIYIENGKEIPTEDELSKFGGLCIDFAHWENQALLGNTEYQQTMLDRIKKFPIGVSHLSVIKKTSSPDPTYPNLMQYDDHAMDNLQEFDYLKKYQKYIPAIAAIELENSIAKQLEVKKYLETLLN